MEHAYHGPSGTWHPTERGGLGPRVIMVDITLLVGAGIYTAGRYWGLQAACVDQW